MLITRQSRNPMIRLPHLFKTFCVGKLMIKIQAVDHLVLRANNPQSLIDFYCNILGCHIEKDQSHIGLTQLRAGNALIDIVDVNGKLGLPLGEGPKAVDEGGRNLDHFCLTIERIDPQALMAFLDEKGVPHGEFVERYGSGGYGDSIYLDDPQGNGVELRWGISC